MCIRCVFCVLKYLSTEMKSGRISTSVRPVSDRAPCQPEVFPSVFLDPGLPSTWGMQAQTHTCKYKHHFTQTYVWREGENKRGKEREREWERSATGLSDWRWQAWRFTGSCTCKPAPWIYLFDFASSVHRSLWVRATVFNCWPQDPLSQIRPPCLLPPHLVPFENINSGRRTCLFAFSLHLLPLKWCMEVTHRHRRGNKVGG